MAKQDQVIRILLIEDSMDTAEQLVSMLRNGGIPVRANRADSAAAVKKQLIDAAPDLVLLGMNNQKPEFAQAMALVTATGKDIPVIPVCQSLDETCFLMAFAAGARGIAVLSRPEQVQQVVRTEFADLNSRRTVRRLEASLREVERRSDALLESSRDPIAFLHEGLHVRANKAYLDMFGYDEFEDLSGLSILDMVTPKHIDEMKTLLKKVNKGEKPPAHLDMEARHADGSKFAAVMDLAEATFESEPCLQITIHRQEMNAEQTAELLRLRQQDLVTGLFNRQHFLAEIDTVAAQAGTGRTDLTVLLIEPDNFSKVLENVGMGNADLLLADMALLIRKDLSATDIPARIGEHTFAVIFPGVSHLAAQAVAEKIRLTFESNVFDLNQQSVNLTASQGMVFVGEKIANANTIMGEASNAVRSAHLEGGNRSIIFDPSAQDKADADKQRAWLNLVKDALAHDGFSLFFQPVISIAGAEGEFYEVLLRLNGPKGEIGPAFFLPVAERNNLMPMIDRWVIAHAIKVLAEREREGRKCTFFLKVTPQSVDDANLPGWIAGQLQAARLRGDALVFGMPESKIVTNLNNVRRFQKGLEQLHSGFAIEQFGSGLNSFQLLKHVAANYLKVDRTFMAELPKHKDNQDKVREICDQARAMGKVTIAEFVEDAASMSILFSCGIGFVQGNFLQEPEKIMAYDFGNA